MRHAYVDHPLIGLFIESAIKRRGAHAQMRKVIHIHLQGLALRTPVPPRIFKGSDPFPLLGIHGNDRLSLRHVFLGQPVDVAKLLIPLRRGAPLLGLHIGLERIIHLLETPLDRVFAHRVPQAPQLIADLIGGFAGPPKQGHRISGGGLLHYPAQPLCDLRVPLLQGFAPAAYLTNSASFRAQCLRAAQFLDALDDREFGESTYFTHAFHSTVAKEHRFSAN